MEGRRSWGVGSVLRLGVGTVAQGTGCEGGWKGASGRRHQARRMRCRLATAGGLGTRHSGGFRGVS